VAYVAIPERDCKEDKEDKAGMVDKAGKEHMIWAKAEAIAFYMLVVDTFLDEWVRAQNCNYHNIRHSILAYIYHY
jgi:hypothetical protein